MTPCINILNLTMIYHNNNNNDIGITGLHSLPRERTAEARPGAEPRLRASAPPAGDGGPIGHTLAVPRLQLRAAERCRDRGLDHDLGHHGINSNCNVM